MDVYLPDLKMQTRAGPSRYSGAADFPVAAAAIREMVRQVGLPVLTKRACSKGWSSAIWSSPVG